RARRIFLIMVNGFLRWCVVRSGLLCALVEVFSQTFQRTVPARSMTVSRIYRAETGLTQGEFRPSIRLREGYGHKRFRSLPAIGIQPAMGEPEQARPLNLDVPALQPMVLPFRRGHAQFEGSSRAD